MRYLKKFDNKIARDAAIQNGELDINSVSIFNGKIKFGNKEEHTIVGLSEYDDEDDNQSASSNN